MKRLSLCLISICMAFLLCSCNNSSVDRNQSIELVFCYGDSSIKAQLSEQDSYCISKILDGKMLYFDTPSCGFDEDISFRVNGKIYCPACDGDCTVKDCSTGWYFAVSQSERKAIDDIFNKYGGYFPCV